MSFLSLEQFQALQALVYDSIAVSFSIGIVCAFLSIFVFRSLFDMVGIFVRPFLVVLRRKFVCVRCSSYPGCDGSSGDCPGFVSAKKYGRINVVE